MAMVRRSDPAQRTLPRGGVQSARWRRGWERVVAFLPFAVALGAIGFPPTDYYSGHLLALQIVPAIFVAAPLFDIVAGEDKITRQPRASPVRLPDAYTVLLWVWTAQILALQVWALWIVSTASLTAIEYFALAISVGLVVATFGVPVAHELMHRSWWWNRSLAEALMCSISYPHWCLTHIHGHHRYVATRLDSATARLNERFYRYLPRAWIMEVALTWRLERERMRRMDGGLPGRKSRLTRYVFELALLYLVVGVAYGYLGLLFLLLTSFIATTMLHLVNYVQHYGMVRSEIAPNVFEPVGPQHSWNTAARYSNASLLNLGRHSDHHLSASREYQYLAHLDETTAPVLPLGLPALLFLALLPPLWFVFMNPRVARLQAMPRRTGAQSGGPAPAHLERLAEAVASGAVVIRAAHAPADLRVAVVKDRLSHYGPLLLLVSILAFMATAGWFNANVALGVLAGLALLTVILRRWIARRVSPRQLVVWAARQPWNWTRAWRDAEITLVSASGRECRSPDGDWREAVWPLRSGTEPHVADHPRADHRVTAPMARSRSLSGCKSGRQAGSLLARNCSSRPSAMEERMLARRLVYRFLFPSLLLIGIGGAAIALYLGVSPAIVAPGAYFSVVAIVAPFEWLFPYHREWNRPVSGDVWGDLGATLIIAPLFDGAVRAALVGLLVGAGGWIGKHLGFALWPTYLPFVAQCALCLVVAEFGMYWFHRAVHEVPLLWRFHGLHHNVPRLYWLNNGRFHPLDFAVVNVTSQVLLLALLGASPQLLAFAAVAASVCGMLAHANIDMDCGVLNWVFNTPQLHRWHHSSIETETNSNYCSALVIWDIVFGTRHLPSDRSPSINVGNGNPRFPKRYLTQLIAPFAWSRFGPNDAVVGQATARASETPPLPAPAPSEEVEVAAAGQTSALRRALGWMLFPSILVANAAAIWWFAFARHHPLTAVAPVCYFTSVLVIAVLERIHPYRPAWNRYHGDSWGDLISMIAMATVIDGAFRGALIALLGSAGALISARFGAGLWPTALPFMAQFLLAVVVAESGTYTTHRLSHQVSWLWRFHALHHHVPRLYWLNNGRFHPVDFAVTNVSAQILLLALLGAPAAVLVLVAFTASLLGMLAHCNVAMECGLLNYVFQSPQLHRWHHSTLPDEANNNYAFVLPVFDLLLGTRHLPRNREPPEETGTGLADYPGDYGRQIVKSVWGWSPRLRRPAGQSTTAADLMP